MDIHKYNTQVRQAMSDAYVECAKNKRKITDEIMHIEQKLENEKNTITHVEYIELKHRIDYLNNILNNLDIEFNVWDEAREICLNIADEMCNKDTFKSDLIHIKGTIWYAGDDIFIECKNPETGKYDERTLIEILKDTVKENSKVSIIINAEVDK